MATKICTIIHHAAVLTEREVAIIPPVGSDSKISLQLGSNRKRRSLFQVGERLSQQATVEKFLSFDAHGSCYENNESFTIYSCLIVGRNEKNTSIASSRRENSFNDVLCAQVNLQNNRLMLHSKAMLVTLVIHLG